MIDGACRLGLALAPNVADEIGRISRFLAGAGNKVFFFLENDEEYCIVDAIGADACAISAVGDLEEYFPVGEVYEAALTLDSQYIIYEGEFWSRRDYEGEYDSGFKGGFRPPTSEELASIERDLGQGVLSPWPDREQLVRDLRFVFSFIGKEA